MAEFKTRQVSSHFQAMDFLRGIAALGVALYHTQGVFGGRALFPHAFLAVDFFFMLSGFVLSYSYGDALTSGRLSFSEYMLKRVLRLYPLIIVGTLLGALQLSLTGEWHKALKFVPLEVFSLPIFGFGGPIMPLNPPAWSLFFELCGSVAFGFVAPRFDRRTLIGVLILSMVLFVWISVATGQHNLGAFDNKFWGGFPRFVMTFTVGILLHRHRAWSIKLPTWWAGVFAVALLVTFLPAQNMPLSFVYELCVVLGIYPAIVILSSYCSQAIGLLAKALRQAGELSYPLYILHFPLYGLLYRSITNIQSARGHLRLLDLLAVVLALLVATVALYGFDRPMRFWLWRRFATRGQRDVVIAYRPR